VDVLLYVCDEVTLENEKIALWASLKIKLRAGFSMHKESAQCPYTKKYVNFCKWYLGFYTD